MVEAGTLTYTLHRTAVVGDVVSTLIRRCHRLKRLKPPSVACSALSAWSGPMRLAYSPKGCVLGFSPTVRRHVERTDRCCAHCMYKRYGRANKNDHISLLHNSEMSSPEAGTKLQSNLECPRTWWQRAYLNDSLIKWFSRAGIGSRQCGQLRSSK
jgi:hypothetical protein